MNLRLKHNAMLKAEYEEKMMKLKEKQIEIEYLGPDELPDLYEIEQIVGIYTSNQEKPKPTKSDPKSLE